MGWACPGTLQTLGQQVYYLLHLLWVLVGALFLQNARFQAQNARSGPMLDKIPAAQGLELTGLPR